MKMAIEMIGYFGSLLVVVSMLMTSVKRLRIVNMIGSIIFAGYAFLIASYPTAFMNICLVAINVYNLVQLEKRKKQYTVVECYKDESIVQMYLKSNLEDIRKFFPDFSLEGGHLITFLVCSEGEPIGVMVGRLEGENRFLIELDYTKAAYRDCSVGEFLYDYLERQWTFKEFLFKEKTQNHDRYLEHMGFEKSEDGYIRASACNLD